MIELRFLKGCQLVTFETKPIAGVTTIGQFARHRLGVILAAETNTAFVIEVQIAMAVVPDPGPRTDGIVTDTGAQARLQELMTTMQIFQSQGERHATFQMCRS